MDDVRTALSYRLARACAHLPGLDWKRYRLVATPVAGMPARLPAGWTVAEGAVCPPALCPPEAAAFRAGQGMTCLVVAPASGAPVAALWLKAGPFDEDEAHLRFEPPAGWAWDTGLYIQPAARGGRAFAALWAAARQWLEARALAGSMSRIADYQAAVLRAHRRMGAHDAGRVAMLRLGPRLLAWGARPGRARLDGPRPVVRPARP